MNAASFERLYDEHAQGVFGFLAYRTGDAALAEELVADVFERVLAARRSLRRAGEKAWIYSIALDRLRGRVLAADEEREALSLRYGAGLSVTDIAKLTGAPRSTVEDRIHRGLKSVRGARLRFVGTGEAAAGTGRSIPA
jgi:DNA-directed RNA polymerase specialized sigma24 family protein